MKNINGFTLAEVLITLGIIGVIAALTIPTLMKNSQRAELKSGFLKANATISTVVAQLIAEKSITDFHAEYCYEYYAACKTGEYAGMSTTQKLTKDMLPYLKYSAVGDGLPLNKRTKITTITGGAYGGEPRILSTTTIYLNDGSFINVGAPSNAFPHLFVDTNGNKGPNRLGYDIFGWVLEGLKALPTVYAYQGYENCALTNDAGAGLQCAQYAISDKCPWDNTKGYWECLP